MKCYVLVLVYLSGFGFSQSDRVPINPEDFPALKAAILLRVVEMEKGIGFRNRKITVYVMNAPELGDALEKYVGRKVGGSTLSRVLQGNNLPGEKVDVIFVGGSKGLDKVIAYTREKSVLSITDRTDLFQNGLSVSILVEKNKPKISLNPSASVAEGCSWELDFSLFQNLVLEFRKFE